MNQVILNKISGVVQSVLLLLCITFFIINSNTLAMYLFVLLGVVQVVTAALITHASYKAAQKSPRYVRGLFIFCIILIILSVLFLVLIPNQNVTIYFLFLLTGSTIISAIIFLFNTIVQGFTQKYNNNEKQ
jgi:hypothetical protein